MQPRSAQCAPIVAPFITTAFSIVVPSPTVTSCSSTARPPIRAPAPIPHPLSTSAAGTIRPSRETLVLDAHERVAHPRADLGRDTLPSRMSNVA